MWTSSVVTDWPILLLQALANELRVLKGLTVALGDQESTWPGNSITSRVLSIDRLVELTSVALAR